MAENKLLVIHNNLEKLLKTKSAALPKGFNETRFMQNAMAVLQDTKDIQKMEAMSVARTMLKGAFLGLDFFNKECYAIPYGNKVNFQTDYKGEIKLAKKYSLKKIVDIYAKVVRAGDKFAEGIKFGEQFIEFSPKPFNNDMIIGVFAVCKHENDSLLCESMSIEEVEKVRDTYSKVPQGKAWKESFGEMAKKTCLRRLTKLIELEFDTIEQQEAYKDSAGADIVEEAEYEPIKMPTPIAQPKTAHIEAEQEPAPVEEDLPDELNAGRFVLWAEIGEEGTKEALAALRNAYKENPERIESLGFGSIGKLIAHFGAKSLNPTDLSPEQYWNAYDLIVGK